MSLFLRQLKWWGGVLLNLIGEWELKVPSQHWMYDGNTSPLDLPRFHTDGTQDSGTFDFVSRTLFRWLGWVKFGPCLVFYLSSMYLIKIDPGKLLNASESCREVIIDLSVRKKRHAWTTDKWGETGDLPAHSRSGELSLLLDTLFNLWASEA